MSETDAAKALNELKDLVLNKPELRAVAEKATKISVLCHAADARAAIEAGAERVYLSAHDLIEKGCPGLAAGLQQHRGCRA